MAPKFGNNHQELAWQQKFITTKDHRQKFLVLLKHSFVTFTIKIHFGSIATKSKKKYRNDQ
jgi:hypothetical protein